MNSIFALPTLQAASLPLARSKTPAIAQGQCLWRNSGTEAFDWRSEIYVPRRAKRRGCLMGSRWMAESA